jgi:hypothetical protein
VSVAAAFDLLYRTVCYVEVPKNNSIRVRRKEGHSKFFIKDEFQCHEYFYVLFCLKTNFSSFKILKIKKGDFIFGQEVF